jgi:hypothetical protein
MIDEDGEPDLPMEPIGTRDLAGTLAPDLESLGYRLAEVVSVQANYSMTVKIAGSSTAVAGVRYLTHVPPRPGSSVWLIRNKEEWHGVGTMAHQAGWPVCRVRRAADGTSYASGAQTVSFDTEDADLWSMWTSGTDVVIPIPGFYDLSGGLQFDLDANNNGSRSVFIKVGSTEVAYDRRLPISASTPVILGCSTLGYPCVAGDVVTLGGAHTSTTNRYHVGGSARNSYLSVVYRGPLGA